MGRFGPVQEEFKGEYCTVVAVVHINQTDMINSMQKENNWVVIMSF